MPKAKRGELYIGPEGPDPETASPAPACPANRAPLEKLAYRLAALVSARRLITRTKPAAITGTAIVTANGSFVVCPSR